MPERVNGRFVKTVKEDAPMAQKREDAVVEHEPTPEDFRLNAKGEEKRLKIAPQASAVREDGTFPGERWVTISEWDNNYSRQASGLWRIIETEVFQPHERV